MRDAQEAILDMITDYSKILSRGKENAIPAPILAEMMHFKTTRKLAADIARSGQPQIAPKTTTKVRGMG